MSLREPIEEADGVGVRGYKDEGQKGFWGFKKKNDLNHCLSQMCIQAAGRL